MALEPSACRQDVPTFDRTILVRVNRQSRDGTVEFVLRYEKRLRGVVERLARKLVT